MNLNFIKYLSMRKSDQTRCMIFVAVWCICLCSLECAEVGKKTEVSDVSISLVRDVLEIQDERRDCSGKFGEQDQENLYLYYEESEPGNSGEKRTLQISFARKEWRKMRDVFIRYYDFVLLEQLAPERQIKEKSLGKVSGASSKYVRQRVMQWDGLNSRTNFERDDGGKLAKQHEQVKAMGKVTLSEKEIAMFYNLLCMGDCLKAARGK